MDFSDDQPVDVRDIGHEVSVHFVCDLAKLCEVPGARIGGAARIDHLGTLALGDLQKLVVVQQVRGRIHAGYALLDVITVGRGLVVDAAKVERIAVRKMAAALEVHTHHLFAGLHQGEVGRQVGGRSAVGLHVGVVRAEQGLRPAPGQLLDLIDELVALVVALAGIAFGVLVAKYGGHRLEHGRRGVVLGRDKPNKVYLAESLFNGQVVDIGVRVPQPLKIGRGRDKGRVGPGFPSDFSQRHTLFPYLLSDENWSHCAAPEQVAGNGLEAINSTRPAVRLSIRSPSEKPIDEPPGTAYKSNATSCKTCQTLAFSAKVRYNIRERLNRSSKWKNGPWTCTTLSRYSRTTANWRGRVRATALSARILAAVTCGAIAAARSTCLRMNRATRATYST